MTNKTTIRKRLQKIIGTSIGISVLVAPTVLNAQLLPLAPTGDLYAAIGALVALDVSDLNAVSVRFVLDAFPSEGIAFDAAGNLYRGYGGLDIYDNNFNLTGHASIVDPISDRATVLAVRRSGQVCACNPSRSPFERLFVFDTHDLQNPVHINTVDIPFSDAFGGCHALAFDAEGCLWVAAHAQLIKLTLDDNGNPTAATQYFTGATVGTAGRGGIAFHPLTGRLFHSQVNGNSVSILDPTDPAAILATIRNIGDNANGSPISIAFSSSGDLFVSCSNLDGAETDIVAFRASSLVGLAGEVEASALNPIRIAPPEFSTGGHLLAFRPRQNPDSDGDGLLDSTEVELAQANGGGCPDPQNPDSDGDGLSDGTEVNLTHTDPCKPDTDGDSVPDAVDPLPLEPGVTCGYLEEITRELAADIDALPLNLFTGSNQNANEGRRNSLASRVREAANGICENRAVIPLLEGVLEKIDGNEPTPDWMSDSPEKAELAEEVELVTALVAFLH